MTLRHVRAFLAVAEELSFTSAARRLHISQPPLSRQIQQLESEIGVQLFLRRAQGIELTEKGRLFLEEARRLSATANEFLDTAHRIRREGIGVVRVGVPSGLWKAVNRIRLHAAKRYPGLDVTAEDLRTHADLDGPNNAFRRHRIDVALTRAPVNWPSVQCEPLFHEQIVVLIGDAHPLARGGAVRLRQVAAETVWMQERKASPSLYDKTQSLYAAAGVTPRIVHTSGSPVELSGLMRVASGEGISLTVASPFTGRHAADGISELTLDEPHSTNPVLLAWRKDTSSKAVINFITSAREVFRRQGRLDDR